MGYDLHWTEEQLEEAADQYSKVHGLEDTLEAALQEKEEHLHSVENPAELPSRFHNTFTLNGLKIAEIRFQVHGKDFRAVCIVIHEESAVFYHITVDKNNQERILKRM
ncbi:MAG: hypothetical protein ABEI07_01860, partial [Candidatus Nanohaloarchaea archaeon]